MENKWLKALALFSILLTTSAVFAAEQNARSLLDNCKYAMKAYERNLKYKPTLSEALKAGECIGWVKGYDEMHSFFHALLIADKVPGAEKQIYYCKPDNASTVVLVSAIMVYINNHPNELNEPAYRVAMEALANTFPCKQN